MAEDSEDAQDSLGDLQARELKALRGGHAGPRRDHEDFNEAADSLMLRILCK